MPNTTAQMITWRFHDFIMIMKEFLHASVFHAYCLQGLAETVIHIFVYFSFNKLPQQHI